MKRHHLIGIALAYVAIGVGRGLYLVAKYPADVRDGTWWARAAFAWPYDLTVDLITNGNVG